MSRAIILMSLLLVGGCVSQADKEGGGVSDATAAPTPSPKRYDIDPDKPRRVCEDTSVGGQPKTVCY